MLKWPKTIFNCSRGMFQVTENIAKCFLKNKKGNKYNWNIVAPYKILRSTSFDFNENKKEK